MSVLLSVENLAVSYRDGENRIQAVGGVDLEIRRGRSLGIVGESGSGKTTLALALLRLLPPNAKIANGRVLLDGDDVLALEGERLRSIRGRRVAMIFQDPVSGLNPVLPIGRQVSEALGTHLGLSKKDAHAAAVDALRRQGLANPELVAASYPFQLSGGMCQRVMIAIATALEPDLIVADEPTSSLDVTMQAVLLADLRALQQQRGTSLLLITHDLAVIAGATDDLAIMYAGRIVERGTTAEIFSRPRHPYTAALIAALPRIDEPGRRLRTIPGMAPDLSRLAGTCAFLERCSKAINDCRSSPWPLLSNTTPEHAVACFNPMHEAPA